MNATTTGKGEMMAEIRTKPGSLKVGTLWPKLRGRLVAWHQGYGPAHDSWATSIEVQGQIAGQTVEALGRRAEEAARPALQDSWLRHEYDEVRDVTLLWWCQLE